MGGRVCVSVGRSGFIRVVLLREEEVGSGIHETPPAHPPTKSANMVRRGSRKSTTAASNLTCVVAAAAVGGAGRRSRWQRLCQGREHPCMEITEGARRITH